MFLHLCVSHFESDVRQTHLGRQPLGRHPNKMATEAGGTHPTVMHSCYYCWLVAAYSLNWGARELWRGDLVTFMIRPSDEIWHLEMKDFVLKFFRSLLTICCRIKNVQLESND